MTSMSFWITRLTLMFLFLLASALVFFVPLYDLFWGFIQHHDALRIILAILAVAWFLLISQLANVMAGRMVFEQQTFMEALRLSVTEARLAVGFVPLIGRWVSPKSNERDGGSNAPIE